MIRVTSRRARGITATSVRRPIPHPTTQGPDSHTIRSTGGMLRRALSRWPQPECVLFDDEFRFMVCKLESQRIQQNSLVYWRRGRVLGTAVCDWPAPGGSPSGRSRRATAARSRTPHGQKPNDRSDHQADGSDQEKSLGNSREPRIVNVDHACQTKRHSSSRSEYQQKTCLHAFASIAVSRLITAPLTTQAVRQTKVSQLIVVIPRSLPLQSQKCTWIM